MKQFSTTQFWAQYDLFNLEIDGITHYLAGDLNEILKNYRLELSNEIYSCDLCRAILTTYNDENGKELETSTSLFIPIQKINSFIQSLK